MMIRKWKYVIKLKYIREENNKQKKIYASSTSNVHKNVQVYF